MSVRRRTRTKTTHVRVGGRLIPVRTKTTTTIRRSRSKVSWSIRSQVC